MPHVEASMAGRGERESKPRFIQMITRHAERLPSGELTPEGIAHAQEKGRQLQAQAEILKAYASDHPSGRAYDTAQQISAMSAIKSPLTGKQYKTKHRPDIQYAVLEPDLYGVIPSAKLKIEESTLADIAENSPELMTRLNVAADADPDKIIIKTDSKDNPMMDIEKLPKELQREIAKIRQKYQPMAFEELLRDDAASHRMAIGLANELVRQQPVIERYAANRERVTKPPQKDVILNTTTHGVFMESLLKEAGIMVMPDGQEIHGITDFKSIGGYIMPAESIYLAIEDPANIPDRIPVKFEGGHRPGEGVVFIDKAKLLELAEDYKIWKKDQK